MLKSKKNNVYIRGALGTQVFEYFSGLSFLLENRIKLKQIIHSTYDSVSFGKVTYLEKIASLPKKISKSNKLNKSNAFFPENFDRLLDWREIIVKDHFKLFPNSEPIFKEVLHYRPPLYEKNEDLHIIEREKKRTPVSDANWINIIKKNQNCKVIGLNHAHMEKIFPSNQIFYGKDTIQDWQIILNAKKVICSLSMFPISTLLFCPEKKVDLYIDLDSYEIPKNDLEAINKLIKNGFNIKIIEI